MAGEKQDKPTSDRTSEAEADKAGPKTPVDQRTQREAAEERKREGGYD